MAVNSGTVLHRVMCVLKVKGGSRVLLGNWAKLPQNYAMLLPCHFEEI